MTSHLERFFLKHTFVDISGVQAADSEITGIDRRVVAVEGSVSETADVATPSATRYVAFDVFGKRPRWLYF